MSSRHDPRGSRPSGNGAAPVPREKVQVRGAEKKRHASRHGDKEHRRKEEAERAKRERAKAERDAKPEHRLHRETPFICNIRFRNNLPEVPADPRLLVSSVDAEQLSEFCLTSIERRPKWDVHFEPEEGIPVSVLDIQRYAVPSGNVDKLDEKDKVLLEDPTMSERAARGPAISGPTAFLKSKVADKSLDSGLPWLMCTTYISNDATAAAPAKRVEKPAVSPEGKQHVAPKSIDDQVKVIEEQFRISRESPKHPWNSALRPVEVLPVLPDFRHWPNSYLLVNFDNDPTEDHARLSKLHRNQRKVLSERGVFKTFSTGDQNFFGYMVPKAVPSLEDDGCRDIYVDELEGEYEWVREYHREKKEMDDDRRTFLLRKGDEEVTYVDLNTNIVVKKRGSKTVKGSEGSELQPSQRPAKVTLKRRSLGHIEEEQRQAKLAAIMRNTDSD